MRTRLIAWRRSVVDRKNLLSSRLTASGPNATNPTHVPASALGEPEMVGAQLNRRRSEQTKCIAYGLSGIEG